MSTITLTDADVRVRDAVLRQLEWDPQVDASGVGVAAKAGVVTLTGYIDTYAGKLAAERAVKRVRGVRAVANDIDVRLKLPRTDTDIANDVVRASEHAEDEAGKRVNKLASEIAVLAAPEIERAALEIAQKLGLLLASHRALAVFARIQATTAAGSLRDPIAGSAGENTNFKRAVAETVESTRIAQFTIGDMLRLELPATAEAAE